jgi:hypothetical protein
MPVWTRSLKFLLALIIRSTHSRQDQGLFVQYHSYVFKIKRDLAGVMVIGTATWRSVGQEKLNLAFSGIERIPVRTCVIFRNEL